MKNFSRKLVISTVAVATIGAGAGTVSAHDIQQKTERAAWRQAAHQALDSGDYDGWLAAQRQAFNKRTSKERFEQLQTFHQLLSDGKVDEARGYAKEHKLGIGRHHKELKHKLMH